MAVVMRPFEGIDGESPAARRAFLQARAAEEIAALGAARPALWAFTAHTALRVDLQRLQREQPDAHPGATLAALSRSDGVVSVGAVATAAFADPTGRQARSAVLFEGRPGGPPWWTALAEVITEPSTGVGVQGPWIEDTPPGIEGLNPYARDLVLVPEGAIAATLLPPSRAVPEVQAAFHDLAVEAKLPADPGQQAEFSAALVLGSMLAQGPGWSWAVKQVGRSVEIWRIAEGSPVGTDDLLRTLANREPEAEGIALLEARLWEGGLPRRRGVAIVAQRGRARAERWYLLRFDDPAGPQVDRIVGRALPDAVKGEGWLGESPEVALSLADTGPEA